MPFFSLGVPLAYASSSKRPFSAASLFTAARSFGMKPSMLSMRESAQGGEEGQPSRERCVGSGRPTERACALRGRRGFRFSEMWSTKKASAKNSSSALALPATAGPDFSWCVSSLRSGGDLPQGGNDNFVHGSALYYFCNRPAELAPS